MKLNFNGPLLSLDGKAIKNPDGSDIQMNVWLANTVVGSAAKENIAKLFEWGLTLQKEGILDLDTTDQKVLRSVIENSEQLTVLSKGRLLEVFDKRENELKEAK